MSRRTPAPIETDLAIWVVVPVFNNQHTVAAVVEEVLRLGLPTVVVDDGSTDGSRAAVEGLGADVLVHDDNRGKGAALLTAAAHIREHGGSHLVCFDADGQFDAGDVSRFVDAVEVNPWSVVYGVRDFGDDVPGSSVFGRRFSNFWARVTTGKKVLDSQCGFRAYPVGVLIDLEISAERYDFEVDALVRSSWAGLELVGVPVSVTYSPPGGRVTHFHPVLDNARISRSYSKLFFRAILPVPHRVVVREGEAVGQVLSPWHPVAFLKAMLSESSSPGQLAAAVALGLFLATLPLIGIHSISIIFAAGLLRLNRLLAFSVSHLCAPPVVPALCLEVGYYLRRGEWLSEFNSETLWEQLDERFFDYVLGSLAVAPVLAVIGWLVALVLATAAARMRNRGRSHKAPPGRDVTARYGSRAGIGLGHVLIKLLGLRVGYAILWLAVPYYWLLRRSVRVAADPYVRHRFPDAGAVARFVHGYRLVHEFSRTIVDEAALKAHGPDVFQYEVVDRSDLQRTFDHSQGIVLVTAHVGRWRSAIPTLEITDTPVHLLLYHTSTPVDDGEVAWDYGPANRIDPSGAFGGLIEATAALSKGEIVSIMGDRLWGGRTVAVEFLGDRAHVPESPFRLARTTGARVLVLLVSRAGHRRFRVEFRELDKVDERTGDRHEVVDALAQSFVAALEEFLGRHPYLWFNFFDFWRSPDSGGSAERTES